MATDEQGNELGKLFVGGLQQVTTNATMQEFFEKFGEVEEATVMMDHRTERSRGFGYVKFKNHESIQQVMAAKPIMLDGKEVDPKPCNINMKGRSRRSLKIFVGGVAPEHNEETLRAAFNTYGPVTDINLMKDATGQRHRGFAFIGFEDETVVKNLVAQQYMNVNGKQVEIKMMEPPSVRFNGNGPAGMMGGRGRGTVGRGQFGPMPGGAPQWPQWPGAQPGGNPWGAAQNGWNAWAAGPQGWGIDHRSAAQAGWGAWPAATQGQAGRGSDPAGGAAANPASGWDAAPAGQWNAPMGVMGTAPMNMGAAAMMQAQGAGWGAQGSWPGAPAWGQPAGQPAASQADHHSIAAQQWNQPSAAGYGSVPAQNGAVQSQSADWRQPQTSMNQQQPAMNQAAGMGGHFHPYKR